MTYTESSGPAPPARHARDRYIGRTNERPPNASLISATRMRRDVCKPAISNYLPFFAAVDFFAEAETVRAFVLAGIECAGRTFFST